MSIKLDDVRENPLQAILAVYNDVTLFHKYDQKKDRLLPATPLTIESAKTIFKSLNEMPKETKYSFKELPAENVLFYNVENGLIIWYTEPQRRTVLYKDELKKFTGEYNVPYLVWMIRGNTKYIFALKEKPTKADVPLYRAPYMNVYGEGSICTGNIKFKKSDNFENVMKDFEQKFFNSYFTHTNVDELVFGNFSEYLEISKDKPEVEVDKYLVPLKRTLRSLIDQQLLS